MGGGCTVAVVVGEDPVGDDAVAAAAGRDDDDLGDVAAVVDSGDDLDGAASRRGNLGLLQVVGDEGDGFRGEMALRRGGLPNCLVVGLVEELAGACRRWWGCPMLGRRIAGNDLLQRVVGRLLRCPQQRRLVFWRWLPP